MTSYFNASVPLYISDGQLNNLSDQVSQNASDITAIEADISPNMLQTFKGDVPPHPVALVAGSFVPLTGTNLESVLPGTWNQQADLIYQYEGSSSAYFLIAYSISGLLATIAQGITFAIRHNSNILPASANVQHYNTTEYVTTSGFVLHEVLPNDIISFEANLLGAINDTLNIQNINLLITKVSVPAI